jgi:hypothetical protein
MDGPGTDAAYTVLGAGSRLLVVLARNTRARFTPDAPVPLGRLAKQGAHEEEASEEDGEEPLHGATWSERGYATSL